MTSPGSTLRYGKVVYRVLGGIGDGPDIGALPDMIPATGTGTLTPSIGRLTDQGAVPATVLPRPIPVTLEGGYLTYRGERGVWLLASESGVWRWHASFTYRIGGTAITDEFYFDLPPGEPDDPDYEGTDLSLARVVLNPTTGIPTQVGPPGRSVADVRLLPDGLLFVMSSGSDIEVEVPSLGTLSNAVTDAEAAAATATAAAATTSTASAAAQTAASTATNAASTATSAASTATAAASSAGAARTAAEDSADTAAQRATAASTAASGAASSESAAAAAAATATAAKTAAQSSEGAAGAAQTAAEGAASSAATSQSAASVSEANAAASAADAEAWAEQAIAVVVDGIPNAAPTVKGGIRIAGDLGGTWDAPTVPALAQKADLVDGKVPTSQIPAVALVKPSVVASQAAMLALVAQPGDVAVRSDGAGTFMLAAEPASVLANWVQLAAPDAGVDSINGQSGAVTLGPADVGAAPAVHSHGVDDLSVSPVAKALLQAATTAEARTAIGAGTSSLALGTVTGTAKPGDWKPAAADISDATATGRGILKAADGAAVRSSIGAMSSGAFQVVSSLPTTGVDGVIYFVRKS